MSTIYLMVGVPGSGKSTLAEKYSKRYNAKILSSDAIRAEMGDENDQSKNWLVFKKLYNRARKALEEDKNIIIDATNVDRKTRNNVFKNFEGYSFRKVAIVKNIPLEIAKERNLKRERQVPEEVIEKFYKKFQMPSLEEFDAIIVDTD